MKLILGDCLEKLKDLADNSVDSIVTDPPYGLSFMGKKWDYDVPSVEIWKECYRVLKHGGHLLAFGGSRTYHRLAVNVEDAGFEIRDQIMWIYGSGFPKSHNIGKAVDKKLGNEQGNSEWEGWGTALKPAHEPIVLARKPLSEKNVADNVLKWGTGGVNIDESRIGYEDTPNPATNPKYRKEQNYKNRVRGQESKGAVSFKSSKNFVNTQGRFPANVIFDEEAGKILDEQTGIIKSGMLKKGTKRLMSDNPNKNTYGHWKPDTVANDSYGDKGGASRFFYCAETSKKDRDEEIDSLKSGRFPANVIFDEEAGKILDEQSGILNKQGKCKTDNKSGWQNEYVGGDKVNAVERKLYLDTGGASRFFYCAKTSKKDRNEGLEHLEGKQVGTLNANSSDLENYGGSSLGASSLKGHHKPPQLKQNFHPTVKPTKLMCYLVTLVTPKNGIVLDPFMGSGSTGKACVQKGFDFIGIEMQEEYMDIAKARIGYEENKKSEMLF